MMKDNMPGRLSAIVTLGVAVLASGCSGGGSSSAPAAPAAAKPQPGSVTHTTKTKLTVKFAVRKTASAFAATRRRPQYVSVATNGLGVRAGTAGAISGADWQLFDVSGTSPACTTTNFVRTCVVSITAPVVDGVMDEFQIDATDLAPLPADTEPMGNLLSSGDVTQAVVAGAVNPVSVSLTGVIGLLSTDKTAYSVWAAPGQAGNIDVNVTANDVDNGQISGTPSSFENPITFSDGLTSSPFTYPNPSPSFLGIPPPLTPGAIPASIAYVAPATGTALSATVTVSTIIPSFLSLPNPPMATFTLDPLVASVAGTPIGAIPGLSVTGTDVTVTVTETGAASFSVTQTTPAADGGSVTLLSAPGVPLTNPVLATNGTATFIVHAVSANTVPADAPVISVADASGTSATLPAVVSP